jgi:hypothetical protein
MRRLLGAAALAASISSLALYTPVVQAQVVIRERIDVQAQPLARPALAAGTPWAPELTPGDTTRRSYLWWWYYSDFYRNGGTDVLPSLNRITVRNRAGLHLAFDALDWPSYFPNDAEVEVVVRSRSGQERARRSVPISYNYTFGTYSDVVRGGSCAPGYGSGGQYDDSANVTQWALHNQVAPYFNSGVNAVCARQVTWPDSAVAPLGLVYPGDTVELTFRAGGYETTQLLPRHEADTSVGGYCSLRGRGQVVFEGSLSSYLSCTAPDWEHFSTRFRGKLLFYGLTGTAFDLAVSPDTLRPGAPGTVALAAADSLFTQNDPAGYSLSVRVGPEEGAGAGDVVLRRVATGDTARWMQLPYAEVLQGGLQLVVGDSAESVERYALGAEVVGPERIEGAALGFVWAGPAGVLNGFDLVASPDSISAGGAVALTLTPVDAEGQPVVLDPAVPVLLRLYPEQPPTFAASEAHPWGRLVQIAGIDTTAVETAAAVTWGALRATPLLYLADGDPPDEMMQVMVSVEVEGQPETLGRGGLTLTPPAVVRLLRQNDEPIPEEGDPVAGDLAAVMVSKVPTEWQLDDLALPFDVPTRFCDKEDENPADWECEPYEHFDPDTFRPEVAGLEARRTVRFCVEVVQDGQASGCGEGALFEGVEGVRREDGAVAYRGDLFLRLVSNEADDGRGTDLNAHEARQTLRVRLGDVVRVTAQVERDGAFEDVAVTQRPVGRPGRASETGPLAARRVDLRWHVIAGLPAQVQHEVATARMSEHWAQAAVRFASAPPLQFEPGIIRNVVMVRLARGRTRDAGSVTVSVRRAGGPAIPITLGYAADQRLSEVVNGFAMQLRQSGALSNVSLLIDAFPAQTRDEREALLVEEARARRYYLAIAPGSDVELTGFAGDQEIVFERYQRSGGSWTTHDLFALAMHLKDLSPATADVIVLPDGAFSGRDGRPDRNIAGKGLDDDGKFRLRAQLTLFITEPAANGSRNLGGTASHEIGHVLGLNHYAQAQADPDAYLASEAFGDRVTNLMYERPETRAAGMGGPKRLTPEQHEEARSRSASLLRPEESGGQFHVSTPGNPPFPTHRAD